MLAEDDWPLEQRLSHDPEVVRWTLYPADLTEEQARRRIQRAQQGILDGVVVRYAVSDPDGAALGTCGIGALGSEAPEIFYALLPEARGRGAATEAVRLLAAWVLAQGWRHVALVTLEGNLPSERVAERAGFVPADQHAGEHRGARVALTRWVRRGTTTTVPGGG